MRARKEWLEWFRVDRDLIEHPKLTALAARAGWSTDKAIGRLIRLWAWVAKHAADGNLDAFQLQGLNNHLIDHEQINAHALDQTYADERCRCCHEPLDEPDGERLGHRVAPFFSVGFLEEVNPDHFIVHDWIAMNGYALRERERDRARKGLE